jgi:chromosome segregation ATPase
MDDAGVQDGRTGGQGNSIPPSARPQIGEVTPQPQATDMEFENRQVPLSIQAAAQTDPREQFGHVQQQLVRAKAQLSAVERRFTELEAEVRKRDEQNDKLVKDREELEQQLQTTLLLVKDREELEQQLQLMSLLVEELREKARMAEEQNGRQPTVTV